MNIITNENIIIIDDTYDKNHVQVFLLQYNDTYTEVFIKNSPNKTISFKNPQDGFYNVCKITLPLEGEVYYKKGKFYHNNVEISLEELLEIPNLNIQCSYFFSTFYLKRCFIKVCQEIFNARQSMCDYKDIDQSLVYKRDLLWSALNVIQYMAETDQMIEATRLLDEITKCNGLCSKGGCGCERL